MHTLGAYVRAVCKALGRLGETAACSNHPPGLNAEDIPVAALTDKHQALLRTFWTYRRT